MRRVSHGLLVALALVSIALVGVASAQQPGGNPEMAKTKNPVKATPASITAGQTAYQKYCRFCHGDEAKGDGKMAPKGTHPSDLTDDKWERGATDGEIFAVIQNGAGPKFEMKGFKGRMSDEDTWNVVNYLRSLHKK